MGILEIPVKNAETKAYVTPFVELEIGGRMLLLRLTCKVIINCLEKNGKSIFSQETWDAVDTEDLVDLIVLATEHMTDPPKKAWVLEKITNPAMRTVADAIIKTWQVANDGGEERAPFRLSGRMVKA